MAKSSPHITDVIGSAGVRTAYGDPVEIDGTTVLPVAATAFLFGAGEGSAGEHDGGKKTTASDSAAAGQLSTGGGYSFPFGAYVTRDGYTRFEPNTIALLAVSIPLVCFAGRALARVIRALKK